MSGFLLGAAGMFAVAGVRQKQRARVHRADLARPVELGGEQVHHPFREIVESRVAADRELVVADPAARRQPVAAGTPELLTALRAVLEP